MARPATDFFVYPINFLLVGAGAVVNQVLTFDASSDFTWYYGAYAADMNGAAQTINTRTYPLADILITPNDTAAQLMQGPVPITSLFGNAESPFVMPAPRIIPARTSITFQLTSRDAANLNVRLSLIGVKKYLG